jgi:hypothetical protein
MASNKKESKTAASKRGQSPSGETGKKAKKPFVLTETKKRRLVRELIEKISSRLQDAEGPGGSVTDLTRLLQLEKELAPKRPRTITVVWEKPKDR